SFIESGVEDARHLSIAYVVAPGPGIGRDESAVSMHLFAVDHEAELVALAVEAQRTVASVVEDDGVSAVGQVNQILLHRGKNAVARRLCRGQGHVGKLRRRKRGIRENGDCRRSKAKL